MSTVTLKRRIEGIRDLAAQCRSEEESRLILQLAAFYERQVSELDTVHLTKDDDDDVWRLN